LKKLKLSDEISRYVKIRDNRGFESEGKIYISKGKIPYVELTGTMSAEKVIETLICTDGSQNYTLHKTETYGEILYPSLIILGEYPSTKTSEITVSLSGVSDWLQVKNGFQIQSMEISKKTDFKDLEITVNESLKAHINYYCTITKNKELQTVIDEGVLLKIATSLELNLDEVTEKCHTICNLFSLLLGHPIDIDYIWIRKNNIQYPVYITSPKTAETPIKSYRECLYPFPGFITERNIWPTIFQSAFTPGIDQNTRFTNLWSRIPSLVRYTTLWEHLLLGYVSILDKHTESFAKKQSRKLSRTAFSAIKQSLKETLAKKSKELKIENNIIIKVVEKYIDAIKNTETPTFNERITAFLESIDPRITEIIGLSKEDFRSLKNLRDQIAHGTPVTTLEKNNITHEITLKNKLSLLLHYCISMDFGLTTEDFINSLGMTTHPVIRGAKINRDKIYKFDSTTTKIKLSKADYIHLSQSKYSFPVFNSAGSTHAIHKNASEITKEFGRHDSCNHICDFLSDILNIEKSRITYHSTIHITSEDNERTAHSCCIISNDPPITIKHHDAK